jgi:hypothetical protein
MDYLIQRGILKQSHGNYKDYVGDKKIKVTGSYGNARGKTRYLTPILYSQLISSRNKDKENFNIGAVKDNQKYMFETSNLVRDSAS